MARAIRLQVNSLKPVDKPAVWQAIKIGINPRLRREVPQLQRPRLELPAAIRPGVTWKVVGDHESGQISLTRFLPRENAGIKSRIK